MKIGILTFHWATNYGAVLQCYALQEYLRDQGYDVEVINYKPGKFDFWFKYLRRPWLIKNLYKDLIAKRKENHLINFRNQYLKMSKRVKSICQLTQLDDKYDVVISGSDQILNPSFTLGGEDKPTPAYYLDSFRKSLRIGYAVSFGCNSYPQDALIYAKKWINNFDKIGVREVTGISVLEQMDYCRTKTVVPDPTVLMGSKLFRDIKIEYPSVENYYCAYILRKHIIIGSENVIYIDDYNNPLSMQKWLGNIIGSLGLLTNSYHGMIMAILNHIPFLVLADAQNMNDRFNTLLSRIGLMDRMVTELANFESLMHKPINWLSVEDKMQEFRKEGEQLLKFDI